MLGQGLNIIFSFLVRKAFVLVLSKEYFGMNGLFSDIINVLSLAELGVGTAMTYALYKPLAEKNEEELSRLMNLYRLLYRIIGCTILVLGLMLIPYMDVLVKEKPGIPGFNIVYCFFLGNTVLSYFFSYKQVIIMADQKAYITNIYTQGATLLRIILQIVVLLITGNYYLYLIMMVGETLLYSVLITRKANQMYPYLKSNKKIFPDKDAKHEIFKNIGAMSIHKIASVIVNNTDNLIMSAYVGLGSVAVYTNYQMIINSLNRILYQLFAAFTAGIGNLSVSEDRKRIGEVYHILQFACFVCYGFCSVCILVLANHFIGNLWIGADYLFPMEIVFVLIVNFYITGMRRVTLIFKDAMGLFWHDRYKPVVEMIINLVASLILVRRFEITGIFLGTLISTLLTCFWVEPYVLFKYGLKIKGRTGLSKYFIQYFHRTMMMIVAGGITWYLCSILPETGFFSFAGKVLICMFVYNGIILLVYMRSRECRELWKYTKKYIIGGLLKKLRSGEINGNDISGN